MPHPTPMSPTAPANGTRANPAIGSQSPKRAPTAPRGTAKAAAIPTARIDFDHQDVMCTFPPIQQARLLARPQALPGSSGPWVPVPYPGARSARCIPLSGAHRRSAWQKRQVMCTRPPGPGSRLGARPDQEGLTGPSSRNGHSMDRVQLARSPTQSQYVSSALMCSCGEPRPPPSPRRAMARTATRSASASRQASTWPRHRAGPAW